MNIESILEKSNLFKELVISSGFKRDLTDFYNSIQQSQNQNIVYMKNLAERIIDKITLFEQNNLDKALDIILKNKHSFFELETKEKLIILNDNSEIDSRNYFIRFNELLKNFLNDITINETEINQIIDFCSKYRSTIIHESNNEQALISIIFKDLNSTSNIKGFTKILSKWNTILLMYHTILRSSSPKEIDLECIQNGSIDVVLNVNIDVALNLTEVFKYGMMTFGTYMAYKLKLKNELLDIYDDNEDLKELENKKEELMLKHIKEKINIKITEQHQKHLMKDKKIETASIDKKIDNIASLITEHIVKGNQFKLLSKIEDKINDDGEVIESYEELKKELRQATAKVIEGYKELSEDDVKLLIETFETKELK